MTAETLALAAAFTAGVAACYVVVARSMLRQRPADAGARRALGAFALWWAALGVNIGINSIVYAAAAAGVVRFDVQLTVAIVTRLLLALGLAGLMFYILFILTGRERAGLVAAFYVAYFAFLVYGVFVGTPAGVRVTAYRTDLEYATPAPAWFRLANALAVIGPPVIGSLALFRLFFSLDDRSQRWRVAVVSWAIVVWWIVAVLAGQSDSLSNDSLQLMNRLVGLTAAFAVLLAYRPPAWVQRRFRIQAFDSDAPRAA